MEIVYHKHFENTFLKLNSKQQDQVDKTITLFRQNHHDPRLRNHALHGKQKGKRAISAGGDLRLIFIEMNNYELVFFLSVGTHNQVYE